MSSLSPTRFERVRGDLLHISLRQVTEDPEPGQPVNLARRAARFTKNRQDLDNHEARKAAERVAADKQKDDILRAKLDGLANNRVRPPSQAAREVTNGLAQPLGADGFIPTAPRRRPVQKSASRRSVFGTNNSSATNVPQIPSHEAPVSTAMKTSTSRPPAEATAAQLDSREPTTARGTSRIVDRTKRKQTHVTAAFTRTKFTATPNSPTKSPAGRQPGGHGDARSDALEADGTGRSSLPRNQSLVELPGIARVRRLIPDSEEDETSGDECSTTHGMRTPSRILPGLDPAHLQFGQEPSSSAASTSLSQVTDRQKCTRKHFRIKRIVGKQVIDSNMYYSVRWRRSWVPSHLVKRSENGRDHFIEIDGKDWCIKEVIKSKMKKGVHKQLVRWADDTQEPLRHLGRALEAVEAFETMPKLKRRVLTFPESLLDTRSILPQSEKHFREAQIHLAKKWPVIQPRNDIDLLPAIRQIILEDPAHPRNDKLINRKTHFRLLDQRQVRPLRWNDKYVLSGRHYECSLPRRNALLLQVVGDTEGNTCCERCMSPTSPFAQCVMDTSDEDPWFNGGCANCGAFEANTTCIHHNVGREDEEGRGITTRVPKESHRESRAAMSRGDLGLSESLFRLHHLHYDNGSDSETYSADSYNSSDESADSASETDVPGEEPGESETLFCTPNPQPDTSHARGAHAGQASSASRNTQGVVEQGFVPSHANRPGALRRVTVTRRRQSPMIGATLGPSTPATQQRAGSATHIDKPPSVRKSTTNGRQHFSHYDRSSSTLAPGPEEARRPGGSDDSQDFGGGDDFWDGVGMHDENFGPTNDSEPTEAEVSNNEGLVVEASPSSASETATNTFQPVVQSIETGDRRYAWAQADNNLADGTRTSSRTVSKKRASSQSPMDERPSRRSLTSMSNQTPLATERALPEQVRPDRPSGRVKEEEGTIIKMHPGCVHHRPCVHPDNFTTRSGHPLVAVYSNEVDGSRDMTIGQAEFIISCCGCHWANGFTEVWADAQGKFGHMWKAEVLLAYFKDDLWRAARECCPPRPGHIPCVVIDDDDD